MPDILLDWEKPVPGEEKEQIEGVMGDLFKNGSIIRVELLDLQEKKWEKQCFVVFSRRLTQGDLIGFYRMLSNFEPLHWRFPNTIEGFEDSTEQFSAKRILIATKL